MNYFAHSYHHLARPYFVAGTAVPDLLSVCGRHRLKRERVAALACQDAPRDAREGQVIAGILRHMDDDAEFHSSPAFARVSRALTRSMRRRHPGEPRLRASFLGHVLTELLLDACLIEADPGALEAYYAALEAADPALLERVVHELLPAANVRLAPCVAGFVERRFLADYLDDARLLARLEQVLRRIGLPPLPHGFRSLVPPWREEVRRSMTVLLPAP